MEHDDELSHDPSPWTQGRPKGSCKVWWGPHTGSRPNLSSTPQLSFHRAKEPQPGPAPAWTHTHRPAHVHYQRLQELLGTHSEAAAN